MRDRVYKTLIISLIYIPMTPPSFKKQVELTNFILFPTVDPSIIQLFKLKYTLLVPVVSAMTTSIKWHIVISIIKD